MGVISFNKFGLFEQDVNLFRDLLFVDTVRGAHGTGMIYQGKGKKIKSIKGPIPGPEFLASANVIESFKEAKQHSNILIGHNRHATKGKVNFECSHPFIADHITLVHNGTLYNHRSLADVEVDSNAIAISIAQNGAEKTLKEIDGAFALIWHDALKNTLNVVRNSERPLNYIKTNDQYIIASESSMLEWLATRNKVHFTNSVAFMTKQLYVFDLNTNTLEIKPVEFREKPPAVSTYTTTYPTTYHENYYASGAYAKDLENKEKQLAKKETHLQEVKKEVIHTPVKPKRWDGKLLRTLGDKIYFSPIDMAPLGNTFVLRALVEEIEDGYADDVEVRLYNNKFDFIHNLLNDPILSGIVSHIGRDGTGNMWYAVRDVEVESPNTTLDGTCSTIQ